MKLEENEVVKVGSTELKLQDLYRHIGILGSTGSGKTWHGIIPLLNQLLAMHASESELKAAFCIVDAKGDMVEHVKALAAKHGRESDIVVIGSEGTAWLDPFADIAGNSRAIADRVMQFAVAETGGTRSGNDLFWIQNERRLLTHASTLARARGHGLLSGLNSLTKAIRDIADVRATTDEGEPDIVSLDHLLSVLALAKRHYCIGARDCHEAAQYLQREVVSMPSRTWSCVVTSAQGSISTVADGPLSNLLGTGPNVGAPITMAEVIDAGKIFVISLPPALYGPSARPLRNFLKAKFQNIVMQRKNVVFWSDLQERPINQTRPVFFVADEFQSLLAIGNGEAGDAYFLDRCREYRCGCVIAAQGLSALQSVMASPAECDHLLNNLATKVLFNCECPTTISYFERSVGRSRVTVRSRNFTWGLPAPLFRVPGLERPSSHQPKGLTLSENEEWRPRYRGEELRTLAVGEAFVIQNGGAITRTSLPAIEIPLAVSSSQALNTKNA